MVRGVQRSVLAGFGPPGWPQGSHRSRQGRWLVCPHRRQHVLTACLLYFQDPSHPNLFLSLVSHFPFLFISSPASQALCTDPVQDWLSVLSKGATYLSPASSWGRAKTGFTFISPARASNCWGGQGQLGARPQPGKVQWSGLVPSNSHQPGGVRSAENSAAVSRCLLSVSIRKAP